MCHTPTKDKCVGTRSGNCRGTEMPIREARSRVDHSYSFLLRIKVASDISGKNVARVVNSAKIWDKTLSSQEAAEGPR